MRRILYFLLWLPVLWRPGNAEAQPAPVVVQPGDTWAALAMRYNLPENELRALNPHQNASRQPTIGLTITLPAGATERGGQLIRPNDGGLVQTAAAGGLSLWGLAAANGLASPYRPTFYRPLYLPGEGAIRDLPVGMTALELSQARLRRGWLWECAARWRPRWPWSPNWTRCPSPRPRPATDGSSAS